MKQAERRTSAALASPQNPASDLLGLACSRDARETAGTWCPTSRAHDIDSDPIPSARSSLLHGAGANQRFYWHLFPLKGRANRIGPHHEERTLRLVRSR